MKSDKLNDIAIPGGDINIATNYIQNQLNQNPLEGATLLNKDLLPSKGKYYSSDIYIKKISAMDLKNLTKMTPDNANGIINTILSKYVLNIPYNQLLVADKLWFLFYLRFFTYNNLAYNVKYECSECENKGTYPVQMKDIECTYINDDFNDSITLPSGTEVIIQFPTIERETQAQRKIKNDQIVYEIDEEFMELACYIKEVNNKKLTLLDAYDYLCSLDAMDFTVLGNYIADNTFGLKPIANCICSCGNIEPTRFSFTSEFFMPKIG